jgi:amidase
LDETVALLRKLGHECSELEIDHGPVVPAPEFTVLYLRSLHEEVAALPYPERLERRIRTLARLGGALPSSVVDWAHGRRAAYAARLNQPLIDHDVLLTPVTPAPSPRIGACEGLGWLRTSLAASATVSYAACWNYTGQPACSVPAGFATDGLPRAVQLVGRPNDEATLIALAAQIEAARPWAQERPAGFS